MATSELISWKILKNVRKDSENLIPHKKGKLFLILTMCFRKQTFAFPLREDIEH